MDVISGPLNNPLNDVQALTESECVFRELVTQRGRWRCPYLGSHSSFYETRKKMLYFRVALMRSDDDFREGSEKAARKESEVPPFVKGRRLHPSSSPLLPLGSRARAGLGGLGGASDSHRHAPWGAVRPWV